MKKVTKIAFIAATLLAAQHAAAEGYWGVKAASTNVNTSGYSAAVNAGVYFGADFMSMGSGAMAAELDITTKIVDGKIGGANWGAQTTAVYAAMRTGSDSFFKAKIGVHSSTRTVSSTNTSSNGLAYGIGFGFDNYEIEYSVLTASSSSDNISMISVGYTFE